MQKDESELTVDVETVTWSTKFLMVPRFSELISIVSDRNWTSCSSHSAAQLRGISLSSEIVSVSAAATSGFADMLIEYCDSM